MSSYNHNPSDSLSNAAYPSDSSYTPGQSQHHHPSDSLANAAYPQDSSYRPSAPTAHPDDKLAMPEARYSQSYNTAAIGAGSVQAPTAPYPQYPPAATQSSAWAQSPTHDPLMGPYSPGCGAGVQPWSPDGMSAANPNLPPPPPYDPARPGTGATETSTPRGPNSPNPSESALLGQQQQQQQQQQPVSHQNAAMPVQPQSNYTAMQQQQTPVPAAAHVAESPVQNGEQPRAYLQSMTGGMPAYGNSPGGLGPVAKARKKKKQKLAILAAILCAVLLFLIVLIVGVLVGVVKVGRDNKPPPPAPLRF